MKKLSITYRATIEHRVPIAVKTQKAKKELPRTRFVIFRERYRLSY